MNYSNPTAHFLQLLKKRECENLEFKARLSSAFKAAKEMTALANTMGGNIIVGVDDNGAVPGVDYPEQELAVINDAAANVCIPPITPAVKTVLLQEKVLIDIYIPKSPAQHGVRDPRGNTLVYVRVHDKNLPASGKTARRLAEGPAATLSMKRLDRHEQKLIAHLKKNDHISLHEFARCANISKRRAMRIIVKLEQASLIRSHDFEKRTFYSLNPDKVRQ